MSQRSSAIVALPPAMVLLLLSATAFGEQLFYDDFNGSSLDTVSTWRLPVGEGTFFGQTQIKPPAFAGQNLRPVVSGGTVTLQLDTYNPSGPGSFWGHEIQTLQTFTPGPDGIAITARMRFLGTPPGGLIGGFFTWGFDSNRVRDEIDFELLTNDLGNEKVFTNVYDGAPDFNTLGIGSNVSVPGLDLTEWNTYTINWFEDKIQWLVNGQLIREQSGVELERPSEVRINLWVPNEGFRAAYSPAMLPAFSPAANQEYELEIDFVRVATVSEPRGFDEDVPIPPAALALLALLISLIGWRKTHRS